MELVRIGHQRWLDVLHEKAIDLLGGTANEGARVEEGVELL